MQFLSPVSLVFVLWLFATAVPAATVLLNGSVMPLSIARIDEGPCRPATVIEERTEEAQEQKRTAKKVAVHRPILLERAPAGLLAVEGNTRAITPSLLHTALQRHRPKLV